MQIKRILLLINISTKSLDHNTDLYNVLPNPNKADERDPDLMLSNSTAITTP
jgi:hypothetical protein